MVDKLGAGRPDRPGDETTTDFNPITPEALAQVILQTLLKPKEEWHHMKRRRELGSLGRYKRPISKRSRDGLRCG